MRARRPLDDRAGPAKNAALAVTVVERPDPTGERWHRALSLLLEAGRDQGGGDSE